MNALEAWLISFMLPTILLIILTRRNRSLRIGSWKQNFIIIGAVLLSAIIASIYAKIKLLGLSFSPSLWSLAALLLAINTSLLLVNKFALFYIISSFIQELCLLANALVIFSEFPVWLAIALIVPLYSIAHLQTLDKWQIKTIATSAWGLISILLFYAFRDIYLNTAIHLLIGAILVKKNVLFTRTNIKR